MLEGIAGFVILIGLLLFGAPRLLRFFLGQKIKQEVEAVKNIQTADNDPLLADLDTSRPALLYFTADWCAPCRTTQSPIIESLMTKIGESAQLLKIDVEAHPDVQERWRIKSLPRTVILRPDRTIHATNIGIADESTLHEQLTEAASADASTPPTVQHEALDNDSGNGFKINFGKKK
jgi:thioredoxin-like negative regulator of GroEL